MKPATGGDPKDSGDESKEQQHSCQFHEAFLAEIVGWEDPTLPSDNFRAKRETPGIQGTTMEDVAVLPHCRGEKSTISQMTSWDFLEPRTK